MATPNLFNLSGRHVHVTYSTSGIDGQPHFSYHDATRSLQFSGTQIESVETAVGMVVSVRIMTTVDFGSTTFSVVIPAMNVTPGATAAVHTTGITAIHRSSLVPAFDKGQLDLYTVVALNGTAEIVEF